MSKISSWLENERPREKLFQQGPAALSDAELIAVLIRSGYRHVDALQLSRDLLAGWGGLRGLFALESLRLQRLKGVGAAKAAALLAVPELARRWLKEEVSGRSYVREPQCVINYLMADLRDRRQEVFKVLFLNKANCILESSTLFTGTVDQTAVHPREIAREALDRGACALVLAHNHPSGRVEPSAEDREITRKLETICGGLSIKVLDHIIIGDNRYFSFREHGLIG